MSLFLLCLAGFYIAIGGSLLIAFKFDRIMVFVLRLANAPVCDDARQVAASIYQHPEQWKSGLLGYTLINPTIGEITSFSASMLHLEGKAFGRWEPNFIERRIIYDAVRWHQRARLRSALRSAPLEN